MLRARTEAMPVRLTMALAASIATLQCMSMLLDLGPQLQYGTGLLAAILALLCVEQVYRNTVETARWAVKFLCLALFAMFVFEGVLYTDALLFGRFEYGWWAARGYANALIAPLVAISAARMPDWRLEMRLSRKVVFHSATLLASGIFLLAVSGIGYGLRFAGGAWGSVAQLVLLFAAAVGLLALIASGKLRARIKVLLNKHFFSYRYDYRNEWLKLTDLIAQPTQADDPQGSLAQRSLRGLAELVDSPASRLWLRNDAGSWVDTVRRNLSEREPMAGDEALPQFMADRNWIVDVHEWRAHPGRYDGLALPPWLTQDAQAWLMVPLVLHDQMIGFVQLQQPTSPIVLDWEVRDVLKTAGRQVAGYLAVQDTVEKLVQARQFDSFNRMSAFVVHDLKNLVAQLSLLLKNAARHRDNPEFQQDMLETVENVLERMQGLLRQLRVGTRPIEQAAPVDLLPALQAAIAAKRGHRIEPSLHIDHTVEAVEVVAHRDRLERVVGHLIQNALEATPAGGSVRVSAQCERDTVQVEVTDTGRGMSREFIETKLFRPFSSTKEHGMGIGAFESREYIRELGGSLAVRSTEGTGTTFTLTLPAHRRADTSRSFPEHASSNALSSAA
jgi:putative PEP-CTERM system histidine kinase